VALAFELIDFGVRITLLNNKGGYTKRNYSIVKIGELNIIL
jgi:hypothetical protein